MITAMIPSTSIGRISVLKKLMYDSLYPVVSQASLPTILEGGNVSPSGKISERAAQMKIGRAHV